MRRERISRRQGLETRAEDTPTEDTLTKRHAHRETRPPRDNAHREKHAPTIIRTESHTH